MWFNSMQREEPYLALTCPESCRDAGVPSGIGTQVLHGCRQLVSRDVGLSPATSATLVLSCQRVMSGTLRRLPVTNRRKVGMTSSPHGPYGQGYTRTTMVGTEGCNTARWSQSQKADPSPDRSLQLDFVKSESLVIADQLCRGEYVPGPCTHRPSHHGSELLQKPLV